jgi:hypothetical protein
MVHPRTVTRLWLVLSFAAAAAFAADDRSEHERESKAPAATPAGQKPDAKAGKADGAKRRSPSLSGKAHQRQHPQGK